MDILCRERSGRRIAPMRCDQLRSSRLLSGSQHAPIAASALPQRVCRRLQVGWGGGEHENAWAVIRGVIAMDGPTPLRKRFGCGREK